ncbi:von Hippel-Lindau disease tumor suppressor,beta alpha domain [Chlorella sorokiniana]|uniref:von Hippel-Lindau disease tumor suppressor,beta alpha domain n=1 Tax=Chlorella sorokiniana TaxID=3076 RepID=A0A2P6TTW6_CHLSO|nr:von Hippel-Lindau disease tumor suppressor,beta alpha domain [Chlorella sorokiniana]|eukprot:PRW57466.1 von Hippel-Lindau disease tumor suppressor,beta alpha domain [Chlorella sorokiniana]
MLTCIIWREEPPARGQDHAYYMRRYNMRRWLWMSYMRLAWEPATHRKFQPAFRAAARTLLLAAHRISHQPERSTAAGLGALPQDVLLNIIGIAAYPTLAWV